MILLVALMGALGRRVCGGAFEQWTGLDIGDFPVRFFFGLTVSLAAFLGGLVWWQALIAAPAIFLGCSIPLTFRNLPLIGTIGSIHFGSAPDPLPLWRRALGLLLHGVGNVAGVIALAVYLKAHWALVLLGGLSIYPAYELGWRITGDPILPWMPLGLRSGSELAEAFWGAAVAVSVFTAFI